MKDCKGCVDIFGEKSSKYMKLSNNETAITNTMFDFSRICRFPNVIGAADVTHVGNKSPF